MPKILCSMPSETITWSSFISTKIKTEKQQKKSPRCFPKVFIKGKWMATHLPRIKSISQILLFLENLWGMYMAWESHDEERWTAQKEQQILCWETGFVHNIKRLGVGCCLVLFGGNYFEKSWAFNKFPVTCNPPHLFIRCNYQIEVWKGVQCCVLQEMYTKGAAAERVEGSLGEIGQAYADKPL